MTPTAAEVWRARVWVWAPALAFFALALGALAVYQSRFAGEAEVSEAAVMRGRAALSELEADRRRLEQNLERIQSNRENLAFFYRDRLSTESERLTAVIAEVRELARTAGLEPTSVSYPDEPIDGFGLRERSFVFGVQGRYEDLRKLINLLELSDSFLSLEQVSLVGDARGGGLRIDLQISTLFAMEGTELLTARTATAPAGSRPAGEGRSG